MASESDEENDFVIVKDPNSKPEARTINGLVTADLTNYDLVTYFPDFTSINNLQVIRMPSHSLEDIPGEDCKIPNSFCNMKYLKKLCLFGDNHRISGLTCLPRDFGQLQSLTELNLQHNSFSVFPEQICQLKNLEKLYLNSCGLTSISTNISSLINLLEADFSQNDFSGGLPEQLFDLPRLKDLYLIECKLDHLPPKIGNLRQLEGIRLNDNFLEEFPDEVFNLIHLKKLSANNNRISKLSPKVIQLQELRVLLLKENNLKYLPEEISKILSLQVVNVFDNKLTCLPETITEMDSSVQFVVHGNEYLQRPPLSIGKEGIDSIKGYLESMKKERPVHSNRMMIVMFGEAGAGKTCLTKALVKSKATDWSEDDSTVGVEMHHWKIEPDGLEACIVDLAGQRRYQHTHPFFLSEEALHILVINLKKYQCNKESFKQNVEDWIEWVTARLLKPRIMIVPTHKDECKEKEVIEKCKDILDRIQDHEKRKVKRLDAEMKKLQRNSSPLKDKGVDVRVQLENIKMMKKHRPVLSSRLYVEPHQAKSKNLQKMEEEVANCITVVPVSSKEELHGVIPLKEEIKRIARVNDLFPSIGRDLPQSWVVLEEAIKKYRKDIMFPNIPCMTLEDFQNFALSKANLSGIQVLAVLKYLDSVGEIKFYGEIGTDQYSVFLDLQWLCQIVKCLFRHDILEGVGLKYKEEYEEFDMEEIKFDQHVEDLIDNGVLSEILLRCIWKELNLDEKEFQKLIKALVRFGLACELPLNQYQEKKLLIPWFLHSELSPTAKEEKFPSTPNSDVTEYKLKYAIPGYLPAGLFDRLCVHSYALGVDVNTWKNSMLIFLDKDIQIFLEVHDTCITVTGRTNSESKEDLWSGLLKIVEDLDSLLKEWPGLVWNTYTVCPHCVKSKESKPHHFECKWLLAQGPKSLRCKKSRIKKVTIELDLLVPPEDLLCQRCKSQKPVSENVTDFLITKLSGSLPKDWKTLASYLGLSKDEITVIDANAQRVEEKTNDMLHKWKTKNASDATRSKLIKALEKTERTDLVEVVQKHLDD
ncbi:malignant fibrous histiocytoma-amplified sequence 1 homolog isoform X2 [Actinia tenebrosa]|nr:malignant fibrous histiocytoma-amplified sequence 1 homolog isoform X2 [Actinia tenebrosa]